MKRIPNTIFFLLSLYLLLLGWWIFIHLRNSAILTENYYWGIGLGVLVIICGITGLSKAKTWGYFSSSIGRFVILLSSGFIFWGIGTLIIGYFNIFLNQAYPYPSIADGAYIISWPLWLMGMLNLSKATGARFKFRSVNGKIIAFLTIVISVVASYYLLFPMARGGMPQIDTLNWLRVFFDFAYPIGDIVIITSSLLLFGLSVNYLGGKYRIPIFLIIFGFILNYVADILFTYVNTVGTYQVASWIDMLYATVFLLLGIGVNFFDYKYNAYVDKK